MNNREYAYCSVCGNVVYRIPGHHHGDGQVDTDEKPVWLFFCGAEDAKREGIDIDSLKDVRCGC